MALHTMSESQKEILPKSMLVSIYICFLALQRWSEEKLSYRNGSKEKSFSSWMIDVLMSFNVSVHDKNNHTITISCIILYTI